VVSGTLASPLTSVSSKATGSASIYVASNSLVSTSGKATSSVSVSVVSSIPGSKSNKATSSASSYVPATSATLITFASVSGANATASGGLKSGSGLSPSATRVLANEAEKIRAGFVAFVEAVGLVFIL
jgi:hypothetical protein